MTGVDFPVVARVEAAPALQRDAHGSKVISVSRQARRGGFHPLWRRGLTDDGESAVLIVAAERQWRNHASVFNPRQRFQFREQLVEKLNLLLWPAVARFRQRLPECEDTVWIEPWLHGAQAGETTNEQPCADQQNKRERKLRDDKSGAQPLTARAAGRSPRRFLKRLLDLRARRLQCGDQAEDQTGQKSDTKGEGDDRAVDADLIEPRQIGWAHRDQRVGTPPGEQESGCGAEQREQQRLDQKLAHDLKPTRTKRRADRDLALSPGRTSEKEIGHICTCNQQDERDRRGQHKERGTHVADHIGLKIDGPLGPTGVGIGILFRELRGDRLQIRRRRAQIDARFQPTDNRK